jgi:hypothetical protein
LSSWPLLFLSLFSYIKTIRWHWAPPKLSDEESNQSICPSLNIFSYIPYPIDIFPLCAPSHIPFKNRLGEINTGSVLLSISMFPVHCHLLWWWRGVNRPWRRGITRIVWV